MPQRSQRKVNVSGGLREKIIEVKKNRLEAYKSDKGLIESAGNAERNANTGAYKNRQLLELIQNGADAIPAVGNQGRNSIQHNGRIKVVISDQFVYCANEGNPLHEDSVYALATANVGAHAQDTGVGRQIGKFGLGVMSYTSLADRVEFFSNGVGIRFDRQSALQEFDTLIESSEDTTARNLSAFQAKVNTKQQRGEPSWPTMALPELVELEEVADDDTLHELLEWAATVVRLTRRKLSPDEAERTDIHGQITDFEPAAMFFVQTVGWLELHDEVKGVERQWKLDVDQLAQQKSTQHPKPISLTALVDTVRSDGQTALQDDRQSFTQNSGQWMLFRKSVSLVDDGSETDGKVAGKVSRTKHELTWAFDLDEARSKYGRAWAYFPLAKEMVTHGGIFNAPWKLTEDRSAIADGNQRFNRQLAESLVELLFESYPKLVPYLKEPGELLDLWFQGYRGRPSEVTGVAEAEKLLSDEFFSQRASQHCLPNLDGELCLAHDLFLPPQINERVSNSSSPALGVISSAAYESWSEIATDSRDRWPHQSIIRVSNRLSKFGYTKLESLQDEKGPNVPLLYESFEVWFRSAPKPKKSNDLSALRAWSSAAIRTVQTIFSNEDTSLKVREELQDKEIVFNSNLEFSRAHPDWVWFPSMENNREALLLTVHHSLMEIPEVVDALIALGIQTLTPEEELRGLISDGPESDADWEQIWKAIAEMDDVAATRQILALHLANNDGDLKVRALDGKWRDYRTVLIAGTVLSADEVDYRRFILDEFYHDAHMSLLREGFLGEVPGVLRTTDTLELNQIPELSHEWASIRPRVVKDYRQYCFTERNQRPSEQFIAVEAPVLVRPFNILKYLKPSEALKFTAALVEVGPDAFKWKVRHLTQDSYPPKLFPSPLANSVREHGRFMTSLDPDNGGRVLSQCVSPLLRTFADVLPVARVAADVASALGMPEELKDVQVELWQDMVAESVNDPKRLGRTLTMICDEEVDIDLGTVEAELWVSSSPNETTKLRAEGNVVAEVEGVALAAKIAEGFGLQLAKTKFTTVVHAVNESLPEAIKGPAGAFEKRLKAIAWCDEVELEHRDPSGTHRESASSYFDDDTGILYATNQFRPPDMLASVIERHQLSTVPADQLIQLIENDNNRVQAFRKDVRKQPSLEARLLKAIGADQLRKQLPRTLTENARATALTDDDIARLSLASHGVEVLRIHSEDLKAAGLNPPSEWAGRTKTLKFVEELGFDASYAGFPSPNRQETFTVAGPLNLRDLHDYQRLSCDRIRAHLRKGRGRGMLSFPTGAGKTRTAVQAAVESMRDGELEGVVLWIAQKDELCEQAVGSWKEAWQAFGASQEQLHISRFWSTNDIENSGSKFQVVIATDAKLENAINLRTAEWIPDSVTAVFWDEAHRSSGNARSTKIRRWLRLSNKKTALPFIGLSATPIRRDEQQAEALANLFERNRYDEGALGEDAISQLQEMNILAELESEELDALGEKYEDESTYAPLTSTEKQQLETFRTLPDSVVARFGQNAARNELILKALFDQLKGSDPKKSILLFATSVDHAEYLSGRLSLEGVSAKAISSRTSKGARNHYLEEFKNGNLSVITNFGVLTEGFDAPAVDAVFIMRPTVSPALYHQMVGRGLRGPLNGGNSSCLIVNIRDNLERWGQTHAFDEWSHLWRPRK